MRIGIEAQRIFRKEKHGMDFAAIELIRHMQKVESTNQFFIFVNEGEDAHCIEETENFKIVVFAAPYLIWEQWLLPKKVKEYDLDVLHCTSNTAPLFLSVPLVVTIHDLIYFENHPLFQQGYTSYQRFGNIYRRWLVYRLVNHAAKIITVSNFERENFKLHFAGLEMKKLCTVYNGVSDHFQPKHSEEKLKEVKKRYDLPDQFVFFMGNTDPKKNSYNTILGFLKACPHLHEDFILVVADFNSTLQSLFTKEAEWAQFHDRIYSIGYVHNQDMPALLSLAEVLLYTSRRESFGLPILEAMACGLPVITSNTSSMPEIAGNAALQVDPERSEEIAKALVNLLSDEEWRKRLKQLGLQRAKEFSWMSSAQKTLSIYNECI
jgi:glycosyltransferase involved in cell wall biosynthesis